MYIYRLTQWEYGPANKHLYDLIGVDLEYPQHYLDLIDTQVIKVKVKIISNIIKCVIYYGKIILIC